MRYCSFEDKNEAVAELINGEEKQLYCSSCLQEALEDLVTDNFESAFTCEPKGKTITGGHFFTITVNPPW